MLSLVMPIYVLPGGESVVHRCLDALEADADGLCRFDQRIVVLNGWKYGWHGFGGSSSSSPSWPEPTITPEMLRLEQRLHDFGGGYFTPDILGFTKAFNQGLQISTGDVIQLNSDAFVPKGWLDTLVRDADITGGVMCCDDNHRNIGPGIHKDRAWGACFYLPRAVIDKVGLWDETLNYRYSDQDYWIRCRKAGFDVSITGNVKVEHLNCHTIRQQVKDPAIAAIVQEERAEMFRRYGKSYFEKWLRRNPKGS